MKAQASVSQTPQAAGPKKCLVARRRTQPPASQPQCPVADGTCPSANDVPAMPVIGGGGDSSTPDRRSLIVNTRGEPSKSIFADFGTQGFHYYVNV